MTMTQTYIKGYVIISTAALSRLHELGIQPPPGREGQFDSFRIPEALAAEFSYKRGNPATPGRLSLASE